MLTDRIKEVCHCQDVSFKDGALTGMKMRTYSLVTEAVDKFAEYIYEVLITVYDFMDKMNFTPANENTEIRCKTIIIWKKGE